ncbi:MAG TPA: hypothetical protein VJK48_06995 [Chlamydiales bacterium]|nr:hypothetical protein [Chlamydiales bacterium]
MNALGFLSFLLSLLSLAVFTSFDKFSSAQKIRSTYVGHLEANRDIFNQKESTWYKKIPSNSSHEKSQLKHGSKLKEKKGTESKISPFNPESARLNLMPLLNGKKQEDPLLYETTLKLLLFFYGDALFLGKKKNAQQFLDGWLAAIDLRKGKKEPFLLEKMAFSNPLLQDLYYKMLKGTKKKDSYPSLLEYFKIDSQDTKISLYHAHPTLLEAFFSPKAAQKLYSAFHGQDKEPLPSRETVERLCLESHLILDPKLLDLCDFTQSTVKEDSQSFFLGKDPKEQISLKKKVTLNSF